ncbi:MAG TPA: ATP-binding protein [Candidatus Eisenbacteria bacterium]|nr:ATP-binding protein [Candidatus Eisenbacteria bacterium]
MTALAAYALFGGTLSLIGWIADIPRLTDWIRNGISIQPNTCVAAMASAAAVLFLAWGRRPAAVVLGSIVTFIAITVWIENLLNIHLGIDSLLLFGRTWGQQGVLAPGRMGPPGYSAWTLLGVSLVLAGGGRIGGKRRTVGLTLALLAAFISAFSLMGYLYGASILYTLPKITVIAAQTATFILAVAVALVAAHFELPPVRWFTEDSAAGALARRTLPLLLVVPVLLGWLRVRGQDLGIYSTAFGTAMLVLVLVALLLALLAWNLSTIARHEREIRKSEERITNILESVTDGFTTYDADWRITFVNAAAERIMAKSRAELLGKNVWDLFPETVGRLGYREMHRSARERVAVEFEDYNPRLERWFACKTYPVADGLSVFFQDVTEQKRAQEELRQSRVLLENELADMRRLQGLSGLLVKTGDMDTLLQEILATAADVLGTDKGNIQFYDASTGALRITVHQGHGPVFLSYFAEAGSESTCEAAARTARRVLVKDVLAHAPLAGTRDLEVLLGDGIRATQSTPLLSRDGQVLGMLNNHFAEPRVPSEREMRYLDLLARMAADFIERTLTEKSLADGDRRKDEFLAILAHELRNPLTPVRNAAHLLKLKNLEDPELVRPVEMIERHTAHMARLIDDLLDVSRISRGVLELRLEALDFRDIARETLDACKNEIESRAHTLQVVLPENPIPLRGDRHRLVQAFSNLVMNAAKYTPPRGRIEFVACAKPEVLEVSVRDNGIGIPAERVAEIFSLFTQLDRSLGRQSGLGIGLTLAKELVTLHRGTLEVRSDGEGKGSTFVVRLPSALATTVPVAVAPSDREPVASLRILVADDNRDSAESLALILRKRGNQVRIATDGEEVLRVAADFLPEIAFLDIGMPRMDGYEAALRLRETPWGKDVFLVALTGWGMASDRERSERAGFDAHVVKPASLQTLHELLRDLPARAGRQGSPAI